MIISENKYPPFSEFHQLMLSTDRLLNSEAVGKESYYKGRNGTQLEEDVYDALIRSAQHTPFEGTIQLISGASFPDIIANHYYGVEVKSTNKNHWRSIGSSILESTRNQSVERIFLTFGKLGTPILFKSRPYEECLSGISVTHYPRYQIDMELNQGETIFDKMGLSYDALRKMDNPVAPVSQYYRQQLKPGESLWWAADYDIEEAVAPPTVRLWNTLSQEEKLSYKMQSYALFPEILSPSGTTKYQRYALWLVTNWGIVDTSIRDQFSAGGQVDVATTRGVFKKVPAVFGRIAKNRDLIAETIASADKAILQEYWEHIDIPENRLLYWCQLASLAAGTKSDAQKTYDMLRAIFEV